MSYRDNGSGQSIPTTLFICACNKITSNCVIVMVHSYCPFARLGSVLSICPIRQCIIALLLELMQEDLNNCCGIFDDGVKMYKFTSEHMQV